MTPILTVALHAEHDIVLARQRVRQVAHLLDLDNGAQTRLATAVSEIARNAFQYGDRGTVEIHLANRSGTKPVLWAHVRDRGPGIADLDSILDGTYRSPTGLGLGLVGARRLVDHFLIRSEPGETCVELGQVLPGAVDDAKLKDLLDRLRRTPPGDAFTEVLQQNQELLKTQHALARANHGLAEANEAKDRFLAMLAHELRNLLNALQSSLEVLQRTPKPAIRQRMEELALGQTAHLHRLVEDLLDASQVQHDNLEIRPVTIDLALEVSDLLTSWREKVTAEGLQLHIDRPPGPLWALADPTRLAQIVGNLLSNACKFTDPGGEIRVTMSEAEGRARLVVADTGCGMPQNALEKIFEPFEQTAEADRRMTGGLGLGLSIVEGLVRAHGGALHAESDGPGQGSRFIVELPTAPPPAGVETAPPPTTRPLNILLVDDHPASAESLAELLRIEGHQVTVAVDAPSALEQAATTPPDIVLSDLGLPGMDGFELARTLRASKVGKHLRLIALSGFADPASKSRALEAGFEIHLSKPVDFDELMRHLSQGRRPVLAK